MRNSDSYPLRKSSQLYTCICFISHRWFGYGRIRTVRNLSCKSPPYPLSTFVGTLRSYCIVLKKQPEPCHAKTCLLKDVVIFRSKVHAVSNQFLHGLLDGSLFKMAANKYLLCQNFRESFCLTLVRIWKKTYEG